jgi:hypothetical protein
MAGIALAGRLAPLITKAASGLGKSGVGQTVRNAAAATAKGIRKEGVAAALNEAAPQAIGEGLAGLFQGGIGAGVGAGAANLGTSALLGAIAGPAAGRTGIRAIAANPLTQQIAGAVTSQAAIGLLGNRSQSIPAQTITPDQQIQAMQLQAQLQGNQLSANSQDLISVLNAANSGGGTAAGLFAPASYQVPTFDA